MTIADVISTLARLPLQTVVYLDHDGEMTDDFDPELRLVDTALLSSFNKSRYVNNMPKLGDTVVLL